MVLYCAIAVYFIVSYILTTVLLTKCCRKLEEKYQRPFNYKTENNLTVVALLGISAAALMLVFHQEKIIPYMFAFLAGVCIERTMICLIDAIVTYKDLKQAK